MDKKVQTAKEENAEFHCIQTHATEEIRQSQEVTLENQESIKQTLEALNGSLNRIFQLYKKQDERLDASDNNFQEIRDFMVKKDTTNGFIEKEIDESKTNILQGHDNRLEIEVRITRLESNYSNIISLLEDKREIEKTGWTKKQQTIATILVIISLVIAGLSLIKGTL
jgi:hypothetical protein